MSDTLTKIETDWLVDNDYFNKNIVDIEWPEEIQPFEKLFVSFYISDAHWDAYKAYLMAKLPDAGSMSKTRIKANTLLNKPRVQEAINVYVDTVINANKHRAKVNIIELQRSRAFYDPASLLKGDGSLKYQSLEDIPVEDRMVIDGIETRWYGKDATTKATVVKLANRDKAIEGLAKLLRLNDETEEEKHDKQVRPIVNIRINGTPQISELPEEDEE